MRASSTFLVLLLASCGASPTAAPATTAAEPSPAVRARLDALPTPPTEWATRVSALTDDDFGRICPWLAENVGLGAEPVTCDDGTTVEPYTYECDPAHSAANARSLHCSVTFGEIVACYVAMREHPCDSGGVGAGLEECAAFESCGVAIGGGT